MPTLQNPIGLIGSYLPETQPLEWGGYVNKYCKIEEATFYKDGSANLIVRFIHDDKELTIENNEFVLL